MFFTILPISNTGSSAAGISTTVQLLYTKLGSFSDIVGYWDSKVPKCFVGLSVLHLLTTNKTTPLHPQYQVFQQEECLSHPSDCVGGEELYPCKSHSTEGTPPFDISPIHYILIAINVLATFMGLSLKPITNI